jgi:hypothetical protein
MVRLNADKTPYLLLEGLAPPILMVTSLPFLFPLAELLLGVDETPLGTTIS